MSTPSNRDPFQQAIDQFHASLAPDERSLFSKCNSADELLDAIKNLDIIKKTRDSSRVVRRVKAFNDSLGHYFAVIGIFVQSHPEYAALVWGAVRLVLQLASNFHEFFDKLTKTLERLAGALPWYEDLARSLKGEKNGSLWPYQASSRLMASLTTIYVDILTFFQSVVRVFTKKDTSHRSRPLVLTSLFWKPFDARFQDTLDAMRYHRELLNAELSLYGHQTTHEILAKERADLNIELQGLKKSSRTQMDRSKEIHNRLRDTAAMLENATRNMVSYETKLREIDNNAVARMETLTEEIRQKTRLEHRERLDDRIRKWLIAPEFAKELEEARERRETGTSEWFLKDQFFLHWSHSFQGSERQVDSESFGDHTIWVQGNPGFGKTVIAGAVIDNLRDMEDGKFPVFYYFFRQGPTSGDVIGAYRSLLMQLLHHCSEGVIFDKFAFAMQFSPTAQPTGTKTELFELYQLCAKVIGPHFIVLDGIDECSEDKSLICDLLKLGCTSRMILLSRPNVRTLQDKVPLEQRIAIGKSNSDDIRLCLQRRLEDLTERGMLLNGASNDVYADHLASGADGMFLWVRLMTDYLESEALSDQDRHDTITAVTMPEKLDLMYLRIIKLICQGYTANKKLARWIILWITFGKRDLAVGELEESTRLLKDDPQAILGRMDFEKAVVMTCAGLVEKVTLFVSREHVPCFRFIHNTVKEYFCRLFSADGLLEIPQDARSDVKFLSTQTPHTEITRSCLRYMLHCMPAQSLSEALGGQMGIEVTVPDLKHAFRLSDYATKLWIIHLLETSREIFNSSRLEPANPEKGADLLQTLAKFLHQNKVVRAWIETIYVFGMHPEKLTKFLGIWNSKLKQRSGMNMFGGHDVDVEAVAQGVEELIGYLLSLEKYWGSSLKVCPGRIWAWDEIDAFVPSRFSDRSSTAVHTLNAGNPSQAGYSLSSQYLCKVSESTPEFLGTLSIWTSQVFEKRQTQRKFAALLKDECVNGWVARYEIWSIGDSPKRLLFHDVPLKGTEVRLQLLQSLRTDNNGNSNWKVQFPLAIGSNLHQFTVLRTIYWLSRRKGKNEAYMRSSTLNLDLDSAARKTWDPRSFNLDQALRVGRCALYTYWIRFKTDGTRLFFIDRTHVAVYSLPEAGRGEPSMQSFCGDMDHGFQDNDPLRMIDALFHPNKPVVAYRTGRRVFLWAYKLPRSRPFVFYETPSNRLSYPEHISFSSGSDHLVVKEYQSELALVLQLPVQILCALEVDDEPSGGAERTEKETSLIRHPNLGLWSFQSASQSLVSGAHVEILSSGESLGLTTLSSTSEIDMHLWRNTASGFEQERIEVIKLPQWEGMEKLKTSVRLPKPGESNITIVLDRAIQPENTFRPAVQERSPVVIRREVGSLRMLASDGSSTGKRLGDGGPLKRKREEIADDERRSGAHLSVR